LKPLTLALFELWIGPHDTPHIARNGGQSPVLHMQALDVRNKVLRVLDLGFGESNGCFFFCVFCRILRCDIGGHDRD
jgi:hypothetical protein